MCWGEGARLRWASGQNRGVGRGISLETSGCEGPGMGAWIVLSNNGVDRTPEADNTLYVNKEFKKKKKSGGQAGWVKSERAWWGRVEWGGSEWGPGVFTAQVPGLHVARSIPVCLGVRFLP